VIIEFTYNYSAKDPDKKSNGMLLEEFPRSLVREGDKLYMSLQEHRIVDLMLQKQRQNMHTNIKNSKVVPIFLYAQAKTPIQGWLSVEMI
jgi:hypothetical protein